jgi:hypothetical protein
MRVGLSYRDLRPYKNKDLSLFFPLLQPSRCENTKKAVSASHRDTLLAKNLPGTLILDFSLHICEK